MALLCVRASLAIADAPPPPSDVLVVPSVRVSFAVPRGWHALSSGDVVESRARVQLSNPDLNRYLKQRARIPKLTFTKHPSDFPSLNPTLQVYTQASASRTPEQIVAASLAQMSQLPGFKIVEPTHAVPIRGRRAALVRVSFPMSAAGAGETAIVDARMLVVVEGGEAAVFGVSGRAHGDDSVDSEFQRLLASIKPVER